MLLLKHQPLIPLLLLLLLNSFVCWGQTPTPSADVVPSVNWFGIGIATTGEGSPAINESFAYARQIAYKNGLGTFSYSQYIITKVALKPFGIQDNVLTGIAQQVYKWKHVSVLAFVAAGSAQTGTNTGYSFSGPSGSIFYQPWIKKPWSAVFSVQPIKSSIGGSVISYTLLFGRTW